MDKNTAIVRKLREFRKDISKEIKVDKLLFFGSRATGKYTSDSDVDLLIVSDNFKREKSFQRAVRLYDYWNLDYPVDFLCLTPKEFARKKKQVGTVQQAVKEGIGITVS